MAEYVLTPYSNLKNIANTVRESSGLENTFTSAQLTALVPGLVEGDYTEICNLAHENGVQEEYDRFQDLYFDNGNLTNLSYHFAGNGWRVKSNGNFKPKYDMYPTKAQGMFYMFNAYWGVQNFDLAAYLDSINRILDFSNCQVMQYTFYYTYVTRVGIIDCTASTWPLTHTFSYSRIKTIDKLIVNENNTFTNTFYDQSTLENITIEGTIANNGIDVHWATNLTHDSIMSFINALKDFSGTTTTKSITFGSTNLAKLTDEEKAIATEKGWTLA